MARAMEIETPLGEDLLFFIQPIGRDNFRDRLPNHLLGSIAKDALCSFVPALNDPVEILAYDRVVR